MKRVAMHRLDLQCGHQAFVTGRDEHRPGWAFFCHACDRHVKIAADRQARDCLLPRVPARAR